MQDHSVIQSYINNFRRHISRYLKPRIGLSCIVYPARERGAILEFRLGSDLANEDRFLEPLNTVNEALAELKQRAFGGNISGFSFSGTNMILEPNRFILIKDDSPGEWNDDKAAADVQRIVSGIAAPKAP